MYVLTIIYALPLKFVCRLAKSQLFQLKIDQYFSLYVTNWFDHSKHAGRFRKCWFGYCDNTTRCMSSRQRTHSYVFTFWKKNFVWYLWKRFAHQWNINNNISIETITWQHNISLWISSLFFLQTPWIHGWNFYAQKCSIKYFHDYFVSFFLWNWTVVPVYGPQLVCLLH